mmetsp:Transcript_127142/g.406781  ORF Transcript_127142/g.406781 Transcript_127142/m.406781 type:complete len:198 (-) Transcript_127142:69-662(-)
MGTWDALGGGWGYAAGAQHGSRAHPRLFEALGVDTSAPSPRGHGFAGGRAGAGFTGGGDAFGSRDAPPAGGLNDEVPGVFSMRAPLPGDGLAYSASGAAPSSGAPGGLFGGGAAPPPAFGASGGGRFAFGGGAPGAAAGSGLGSGFGGMGASPAASSGYGAGRGPPRTLVQDSTGPPVARVQQGGLLARFLDLIFDI